MRGNRTILRALAAAAVALAVYAADPQAAGHATAPEGSVAGAEGPWDGSAAVHEGGTAIMMSAYESGLAQGEPRRESGGVGWATIYADTSIVAPSVRLSITSRIVGLTGDITAAHFHGPAYIGETAVPIVPLNSFFPQLAGGQPFSVDVSPSAWEMMVAGRTYINIHTAKYPAGEIRGQLCFSNCAIASLFGEAERPVPTNSPAYGVAQVIVGPGNTVTIPRLWTSGWPADAPPTGAHIHAGGPSVAGPVLCPISPPLAASNVSCVPSSGSFSDANIRNAVLGGWYVNVHTGRNPDGEIRGQLVFPSHLDRTAVLQSRLTGSAVVPYPVASNGSGWAGWAPILDYTAPEQQPNGGTSATRRYVTWGGFTGLSSNNGPVTLHAPATPSQNAIQQAAMPSSVDGPGTSVSWSNYMIEPNALTTSALPAGSAYLVAASSDNPSGELRGQVVQGVPGVPNGAMPGGVASADVVDSAASSVSGDATAASDASNGDSSDGSTADGNEPIPMTPELMNVLKEHGLTIEQGWDEEVLSMLATWIQSGEVEDIQILDDDSAVADAQAHETYDDASFEEGSHSSPADGQGKEL